MHQRRQNAASYAALMAVEVLSIDDRVAAAELWATVALTRPWNDPLVDFDRAIEGPTSTVLGLRDDGDLVGTVMVGHDGHRGWIYYLAVSPDRQGRGLGATLLRAAEEWLHDAGAVKVQLMVRHDNQPVLGFYERLGYRDDSVVVVSRWLRP
jgi:ribosomal protein S18 acetylase RimI-like enzyme